MINPEIFRSYDIRGSSLTDINPINSYKIGYCFAKMTILESNNIICVGFDGRLSSPEIFNALVHGLTDGGASCISIGLVPTPLIYYADKKLNPIASIMVTGSHNPKDDNGFKMTHGGKSFFDVQIQQLFQLICDTNWPELHETLQVPAEVEFQDFNGKYVEEILHNLIFDKDLKIAWDPGNGAAGKVLEIICGLLPNDNIVINSEIDGNFPAHHPDPTVPKNLEQLISLTRENNCDLGIAFDGDADRIGVVTQSGRIVYGDQLLCLFAEDILKENPGAMIIADVKSSQVFVDQVKLCGGNPLIWKTGHSHIKTKMAETGALLAGEMSGHIFFADKYYGYDDAVYAALRLLDLVSRSSKTLDQMLEELPVTFNTPEIRIMSDDNKKFKIIESLKENLTSRYIKFNDIDGLRVNTEHGWWLLRASNTQPAIIARCESNTEAGLNILKSNLIELLAEYNIRFGF